MQLARSGARAHALQLGEQRPEQLQLPGIAHLAVGPRRLDLGEQQVVRPRFSRQIVEAAVPGHQLRVAVGEAVDAPFQLDEPPDGEPIEVLVRLGALEVKQRRLVLPAII